MLKECTRVEVYQSGNGAWWYECDADPDGHIEGPFLGRTNAAEEAFSKWLTPARGKGEALRLDIVMLD